MSMRHDSGKFPFYLLLIFFFLSLGILTTGYIYYKNQEGYIKKEKQQELAAIIALKIEQIISWRQECLDYANTVMDDPLFARRVREFMTGRPRPALQEQIRERLTALAYHQFHSLVLIDPQGMVRLSAPAGRQELTPYLKSLAAAAGGSQKIGFSDLYREDSKVMLSVLTPILVMQGKEKITVGVLAMKIEPYQFLYPLLKSWPTPSRTGETELIRREADEVVFLNELRHRKNVPLDLRLPVNSPQLLAAFAARGEKGVFEGLDYRGVAVLAAVGSIPDSPWLLIAKVDAEEIYAPLRKRSREVALFLFILIGASGLSLAYFWRNQQSRFYRRQYETESLLASQLLSAQEDERKRISRELHDELGHALLALNLQIESVAEQLLPQQESLKAEVDKIVRYMGTTIEGVRRLYLDLTPGDLEDLGLTTALQSLVEDFADLQKNIKWSIKLANVDGLFPLPVQTAIYRVVQEALTNIGRHAKPRQVRLEIARKERDASFTIEDDGQGFEPRKTAEGKKTLGLLAMQERVKMLGGSFHLWSEKNRGTRISFTIPISGGAENGRL